MPTDKELRIRVAAVDSASGVFKKVGENARKELSGLARVKSVFGEEGSFGNLAKLAAGTGAVAGLSLAGRLLTDATGKAVELRDALGAGKISAGEMVEELAKAVPVFGNIFAAGRNIRELITGEKAETERIKREAEAGVALMAARLDNQKKSLETEREFLKVIRQIKLELALGAATPGEAARLSIAASSENRQESIRQLAQQKRDALAKDIEDQRKAAQDALAAASAKRAEAEQGGLLSAQAKFGDAAAARQLEEGRRQEREAQARVNSLVEQQRKRLEQINKLEAEALGTEQSAAAIRDVRERFADIGQRLREYADRIKKSDEEQQKQDDRLFNQRQKLLSFGRSADEAIAGPLETLRALFFGDPSKRKPSGPPQFAAFSDEGFTTGAGLAARAQANRVNPLLDEQRKANNFFQQYLPSIPKIYGLMDRLAQLLDRIERNKAGVYSGPQ